MIQTEVDKFLKCDLHMHSSTDYSRKYTKNDFIQKIIKSELDVISITDHNIIDCDLYKEIEEKCKKKIIGGCELNISLSKEEIEKHQLKVKGDFFHGVIWYDLKDIDIMWESIKKYLKKYCKEITDLEQMNLTELSKKLANFSFELDKFQTYINNINYYFVFHENKGSRNLSDYLDNKSKKNEKYKDKLFYYNNNMGLDGSKQNKKITSYFEKDLNTIVSSFLFSDAKELNEIGKKYSWINFDGQFKNLILAISDPDVRIYRSDEVDLNPQKNLSNYLETIKFQTLDGENQDEPRDIEIFFNPGLNGIIGSRGSGKTMLGNILGNSDLSNYSDFVLPSSIKYKLKDSTYSENVPNCKYLHQNNLLKIYEDGNYMELDFIKEYYKEILNSKRENITNIVSEIKKILSEEKNLIIEMISNYPQVCSSDFLSDRPKGEIVLHDINNFSFPDNIKEIEDISSIIVDFEQNIKCINNNIDSMKFTNKFEESNDLFSIIDKFKKEMKFQIENITKMKDDFSNTLNKYNTLPILKRKNYLEELSETVKEINKTENNQMKIFNEKYDNLLEYILDIYTLNKTIIYDKTKIDLLYNKIFENNNFKNIKMDNGEEISVATNVEKQKEYSDILAEQFKEFSSYSDVITKIIIHSNDNNEIKKIFNGIKYKSLNNITEYIEKLYKI